MTHPTKLRATTVVAAGAIAALTVTNGIIRASLATLRSRRCVPSFSRSLACVAVGACLLAGLVASARPAQAAFPGANGKIAFVNDFDIYVVNPDGSGQTRLTNNADVDTSPAWSPNGSKLAFMSLRDGNPEIYVMDADGSGQTRLTNNPASDQSPAWSPDGLQLAFTSVRDGGRGIYVMHADGSDPKRLTNSADWDPAWSPDGSMLAVTSGRDGSPAIYTMNADGGDPKRLTDGFDPAWSPDGSKLAFARESVASPPGIYTMNADGSGPTRLTEGSKPAWSPDGSKLVFASSANAYVINADGGGLTRLTTVHPAVPLVDPDWQPLVGVDFTAPVLTLIGANPLMLSVGSPYVEPGASALDDFDGDLSASIVSTGLDTMTPRIHTITYTVADAAGNTATATRTVLVVGTAPPSANGRIAFTSNRDGRAEIYVMDSDGSNQTRLTTIGGWEPAWSPDGTKLAFTSLREGNYEIHVIDADGSNLTRVTTTGTDEHFPVWSPDGSMLAFASWTENSSLPNWDIYAMNADGTSRTQLTTNLADDFYPAWSPDGTRLALTSWRDGNPEIYAMNADGSNQERLTTSSGFDGVPSWSPDGKRVAFESKRDGKGEIYVMNADGSNQTRLTTDPADDGASSWSPDGTKIAFTDFSSSEINVMNADGSGRTRLTNNAAADYDPSWQPVADTTPPTLSVPGPLPVDATGPAGAIVSFTVSATDNADQHPSIVCTPPSGSTFGFGETTVSCTATDASGNTASATFTVYVKNATEQLRELQALIGGYHLKRGLGADLSRYLNLAVKYIGREQAAHACQQLDQFLATVERTASKTPPWLSSSQATTLTEGGRRIRAVVGC